jgi:basic membrane protein A
MVRFKYLVEFIGLILTVQFLLPYQVQSGDKKLKVAMILPGRINDVSWNQAAYEGLKQAEKELGVEIAYTENVSVADVERVLREYATAGYDLILAHSFNYGDAVFKVAQDFPKIKFGWATGFKSAPNVAFYDWPAHEVGYLVGMLAASMSKTGKVGALGGFDVPDVVRAIEGFKLGAKAVNPEIKVFTTYIGDWEDAAKAKEAALAHIENGADVVYINGDGISYGVIEAAKEKGVYAIGGIADQYSLAPKTVLSSTVLNVGFTIKKMIEDVQASKFKESYLYSLKEGGVDIAPYHELEAVIPQEVKDKIAKAKKDILEGKLQVPDIVKPTE